MEECWSELFLLSIYQWSQPMETCPLLGISLLSTSEMNGKGAVRPADIRYLQDLFGRFRSAIIDPAEFACLKAIVLFRPGILSIVLP